MACQEVTLQWASVGGSFRAQAKQELLCGLRIGCNAMPTGVSWKKDERRQHRAVLKYKKVEGDKWSIDTSKDRGAVRPIDLVSRDPDRLREHVTIEAAVAFEEECYKEAERLKATGGDWLQYRYIPRRQLNILEDHRHDWSKLREVMATIVEMGWITSNPNTNNNNPRNRTPATNAR